MIFFSSYLRTKDYVRTSSNSGERVHMHSFSSCKGMELRDSTATVHSQFCLNSNVSTIELSTGKFDKWRFIYRETSKTIHFQSYREMQSFIFLRRQNVKKGELLSLKCVLPGRQTTRQTRF